MENSYVHIKLANNNAILNIRQDKIVATYVSKNTNETTIYVESGKTFVVPTEAMPKELT